MKSLVVSVCITAVTDMAAVSLLVFFWCSSGVLLGSSGFFWCSSVLSNTRRTPEEHQKNPEEPRRTQKEKNTSPPVWFGSFLSSYIRLHWYTHCTVHTETLLGARVRVNFVVLGSNPAAFTVSPNVDCINWYFPTALLGCPLAIRERWYCCTSAIVMLLKSG